MGEKDTERRHRSGSNRPGAQSSSSNSRGDDRSKAEERKNARRDAKGRSRESSDSKSRADEDRDAKRKGRRSDPKTSVGAHTSSSASDRASRKESRHSNSDKHKTDADSSPRRSEAENLKADAPVKTAPLDDGYAVEAMAVNDEDDRVRKLEAQMAAMMQPAAVTATSTPAVANVAVPGGGDSDEATDFEYERTFLQKYGCGIAIVLLVAIGGGVAGYLLSQGDEEAVTPAVTPTTPTDPPVVDRKYPPPSDAACARLFGNTVVETENIQYVDLSFDISLAQPLTDAEIDKSLVQLDDAIYYNLIPILIGCPPSSARRHLATVATNPLRYMIADASWRTSYALVGEESTCDESIMPEPCFTAVSEIDVWLKGEETSFDLNGLISDLFAEMGEELLALPSNIVAKSRLSVVTPGDPPTDDDDNAPAEDTSPPIAAPTDAPVLGPTPVQQPVVVPISPTVTPIANPTVAPDTPTAAPVMLDSAERNALLQTILADVGPLNNAALNFLSNDDTWQPDSSSPNANQQWIERYVMVVLYSTMGGDNWSFANGWSNTANPTSICDGWSGIESCSDNLVSGMDLSTFNLVGTVPTEIGLLTDLVSLRTSDNPITGTIPSEIGSLSSLEHLSLSATFMAGSIPTEVARMTSLTYLSLHDTVLTGAIPALPTSIVYFYAYRTKMGGQVPSIGQLTNLIHFEVYDSQFTGTIPSDLELLTQVEWFNFFSNNMVGSIPSTIRFMTNLLQFEIDNMGITGTIPTEIGLLTRVTTLHINENELFGSIPTEIGDCLAIREFRPYANSITGTIPTEIGMLSFLEELDVHRTLLTGTVPTEIGRLRFIEDLRIDRTTLSGPIPSEIGFLTLMTTFTGYDSNINGAIPTDIGRLALLEYLILYNSAINGPIPREIGNLNVLLEFKAYETNIAGRIPREIGGATSLIVLELDNTNLSEQVPNEIIRLTNLQTLHLYSTDLTGDIPELPTSLFGPENCRFDGGCFGNLDAAIAQGCNVDGNCA